jgi:imidazolonepropionase-like amidohydrolase
MRLHRSFLVAPLLVALVALAAVAAGPRAPVAQGTPPTAVRFGKLVDGSGRVITDAVVVINKDTIVRVGTGDAAVPAGARVIDLRRYTGIPGMIDVHTHMTYVRDKPVLTPPPPTPPTTPPTTPAQPAQPAGGNRRTPEQLLQGMAQNALHTLETGVTTVRDLGASNYTDIALRDSINRGVIIGPRMFVAGYGLSKANGTPRAGAAPGAPRGQVRDTAEIARAVAAQVAAGADWIKMYGSTGSYANVTGRETFTFEEMKAAADAAHRAGKKIAIHSYGPEGGRDAMLAGAQSVEHPIDLDDATIAEFVRRGTYYVPTIDHNRFYAENAPELGYTADQVAGLNAFRAKNMETARRAIAAGVKIAMGSDAVYWMFGENTRELGWLTQAGMSPAQALATATTNAADLLGMPTKLGKVAPGFFADIVAVEGDPMADISVVIHHVVWVMKGGAVVVDTRTPR